MCQVECHLHLSPSFQIEEQLHGFARIFLCWRRNEGVCWLKNVVQAPKSSRFDRCCSPRNPFVVGFGDHSSSRFFHIGRCLLLHLKQILTQASCGFLDTNHNRLEPPLFWCKVVFVWRLVSATSFLRFIQHLLVACVALSAPTVDLGRLNTQAFADPVYVSK